MGSRLGIAGVALLLLLALFWMAPAPSRGPAGLALAPEDMAAGESARGEDQMPARAASTRPPEEGRQAASLAPAADSPVQAEESATDLRAAPQSRHLRGRALDLAGLGLSGVTLWADGAAAPLARSGPDGSFEFEVHAERTRVHGKLEGWTSVRLAVIDSHRPASEALVVLAPAVSIAGRVIGPEGEPVALALLQVEQDWTGIPGFPFPLDHCEAMDVEAQTDEEGSFAIAELPRLPGRKLEIHHPDHQSAELEVPAESRHDLEIRLAARELATTAGQRAIFGRVRFPDGKGAEGALVRLASSSTRSGEGGAYELPLPSWHDPESPLAAALPGWQGVVRTDVALLLAEPGGRVGPVDLDLAGPALHIRGRLELADGSPASGFQLEIQDPTILDPSTVPSPTLESGGERTRSNALTDERGRFEIGGLGARTYRLRLWDRRSWISVESGPVQAGEEDLVLRVPGDAILEKLEGRIVTRGRNPVEGARVTLQFVTARSKTGFTWQTAGSTHTASDGSFCFEQIPRRGMNLVVDGAEVVPRTFEPPGGEFDHKPLEIEVERLMRVRLDFAEQADVPGSFELLDAAGRPLGLELRAAYGSSSATRINLEGGRSPVVAVSEAAATLVLYSGGRELSRRGVLLQAGEVNLLSP